MRTGFVVAAITTAVLAGCVSEGTYQSQVQATQYETALAAQYQQLNTQLKGEIAADQVQIKQLQGKLVVTFVDELLFASGSAEVHAQGRTVLDKAVPTLAALTGNWIKVQGYTDNEPIGPALRGRYPTNWDLSAARATDVVKYLQSQGVVSIEHGGRGLRRVPAGRGQRHARGPRAESPHPDRPAVQVIETAAPGRAAIPAGTGAAPKRTTRIQKMPDNAAENIERDVMEYDVVIVGAGPAGLACAIRLKQLKPDLNVCVLEKAASAGAHMLSGAVIEPGPLDELLPEWRKEFKGICVPAGDDEFALLTRTEALQAADAAADEQSRQLHRLARQPRRVTSRGKAEALGCDVFAGFAAAAPLFDDQGAVAGVRIGDMGLEKDGTPGPNFAPGPEIRARTTILAEGCRGSVSKVLIERFRLDAGKSPQTYGLGFKELWQLPPGRVAAGHDPAHRRLPDGQRPPTAAASCTTSTRTACTSASSWASTTPTRASSRSRRSSSSRTTRASRRCSKAARLLAYGARTIVEGGWQSMPTLEMPGAMLVGDAGGTLNVPKIKGVHQAMRCGALAAEHLVETGGSAGLRPALAHLAGRPRTLQGAQHPPGLQARHVDGHAERRARDRHRRPLAVDARATTPTTRHCSDSTSTPRPTAAGASARSSRATG